LRLEVWFREISRLSPDVSAGIPECWVSPSVSFELHSLGGSVDKASLMTTLITQQLVTV